MFPKIKGRRKEGKNNSRAAVGGGSAVDLMNMKRNSTVEYVKDNPNEIF